MILTLLALAISWQVNSPIGSAQPSSAAPVVVSKVVEREFTTTQTFIGTVMPMRTSVVGSAVDGRVFVVAVDEGDAVDFVEEKDPFDPAGERTRRVGQPVAQLRTRTLELEISAARAQLDQFKSELEELQRTIPEQQKQALATLEETAALADFTESKHSRLQRLAKQSGAVTNDELDEAFARMIVARQIHLKAKSAALLLDLTRDSKLAQAKARLLSQQATVDRLEDVKRKYTIRAPFKGFVVAVHTEVGAWV
ncbi:MAG: hypothetical protein IH991_07750, partial [Planctomycetes bacterium]|nr:hypothetical protein [Planctomycetota bacterium]